MSVPPAAPPPGAVLLLPVPGVPEVRQGDDLAELLAAALAPLGGLRGGDVLVVSSKVVSKALGLREEVPPEARGDLVHAVEEVAHGDGAPRGALEVLEGDGARQLGRETAGGHRDEVLGGELAVGGNGDVTHERTASRRRVRGTARLEGSVPRTTLHYRQRRPTRATRGRC